MRKRYRTHDAPPSRGLAMVRPSGMRYFLQIEVLEDRNLLTGVPALLSEINPTAASNPAEFIYSGDLVFFSANDGTNGSELWKTDGTTIGTVMVKDIQPLASGSSPFDLTAVGGTLFFAANDGTNGVELWKSDGTAAGTALVKDINPLGNSSPSQLTNVGGTLYFSADNGTNGAELWKSDGTLAGTTMVMDINPSIGSNPNYLTKVDGKLFFQADDGVNGIELWMTDAGIASTTLLKDINPGSSGSSPGFFGSMMGVGGILFFSAVDSANGFELWKSDGTTGGTTLVKDIRAGSASSLPFVMTDVGGTLFFTADNGSTGFELWKSNGTGPGTTLVMDINTMPGIGSAPDDLENINGTLYFRANDGSNGVELWKSDGTVAGTTMVLNISPAGSSTPRYLTNANGSLYFRANDGTNGVELWKSNGTAGGTSLVADIAAMASSSNPRNLANIGGTLFFSAQSTSSNQEPWILTGTSASVVATHLFYNQSKFDGFDPAADPSDDGAIASDKSAYRPGDGLIGPISVTSYTRGINGVMIDIANPSGPITASDFTFRVGANNTPSSWSTAPAPTDAVVRVGAGVFGSDRVEIIWANGAIGNTYLQVIVEGNDATGGFNMNTGLASSDVFFWGNRVGDSQTGTPVTVFQTTATDATQVFATITGVAAIDDLRDYNRSGDVTTTDAVIVFANIGTLARINIGSAPPAPAPPVLLAASDTGVSNSDQITKLNNAGAPTVLQFEVGGTIAGATVAIEADGTTIGTAIASGSTTTVVTNGTSTLAGGIRSITARQSALGQSTSAPSAPLTITIDTTAPVSSIVAVAPDPRTTPVSEMTMQFDEPVFGLDIGALDLVRNAGSDLLTGAQTIDTLDGGLTWTLHNLAGITTLSGFYELILTPLLSGTIDVAGNSPVGVSSDFTVSASVLQRRLFYNQSAFDGNDAAANALDDSAVATDKVAYLPGDGLAGPSNVSSYTRGINGIMVDLANASGTITASDFTFKVGNDNAPDSWTAAPVPSAVVVRAGEGVSGSDRVEIIWANGAITNAWLEVIVEGNDALGGFNTNTGLAASDVFFFGNRVGDSGTSTPATVFQTTSTDATQVFANITGSAAIDDLRDYNRSGNVTSTDAVVVFANIGTLARIDIGADGPFAPVAEPESSYDSRAESLDLRLNGVSLSMTVGANGSSGELVSPRSSVKNLDRMDDWRRPPIQSIPRMVEDNGPRGRLMRVAPARIVDSLLLDEEWFDSLSVELDLQ